MEQDSASGSIIAYGVVSDITARKQAEEALRGTEHRLRTIINNTPLILFALDHEGIFTLSEGKGLDLIGQKPGELVGRSIFDNMPDDRPVCSPSCTSPRFFFRRSALIFGPIS